MATRQNVRNEVRVCPGCNQEKSFPARSKTCSVDCRYRLEEREKSAVNHSNIQIDDLAANILATLKRQKNKPITLAELANKLDRGPAAVEGALDLLKTKGFNVALSGGDITLSAEFAPSREVAQVLHPLSNMYSFERKIGACGDNHLGSHHERLDVLNALYDLYEAEGITDVYNTGNWIEGEMRLNRHDIKVFGLDGQIQYLVDNYPQRKGITTHFVAGDDHEGWYQRNERMEIGRYAEMAMQRAGRNDFHYLGYVEADILLKADHGERIMKVMHPGGGSAYATSYAPQKLVESFQGGERPEILLLGHYHKFDHGHYRNTHYVQTGCTVDQSIFMRKQKISAAVGGTIVTFNQAPDGAINRFKVEWIPFYDRGYYGKKREFGIFPSPESMVK